MSKTDQDVGLSFWTEADAENAANRILEIRYRIATDVVSIGRILIEAKERLPHGAFLPWLERLFRWTERTAQNFMSVAERIGEKAKYVSHLPLTTVYRLAAPSTPKPLLESLFERLESGEQVGKGEIESQIGQARRAMKEAEQTKKELATKTPEAIKREKNKKEKEREDREQRERDWRDRQREKGGARDSAVALLVEKLERDDLVRLIEYMTISNGLSASDFQVL
jgi:hypothetical protein